jgi:hypothetical protein
MVKIFAAKIWKQGRGSKGEGEGRVQHCNLEKGLKRGLSQFTKIVGAKFFSTVKFVSTPSVLIAHTP